MTSSENDEELLLWLRAVCTCNIDSSPCMAEDDCRDAIDAADLLTALLTANAALRAERDVSNELGRAFEQDAGQQRARAEAAEAQIAALTARVEGLTGAVKGLVEILDQHETKGPLPDVALMFCWLAAQEVRAVMRKDGGQ